MKNLLLDVLEIPELWQKINQIERKPIQAVRLRYGNHSSQYTLRFNTPSSTNPSRGIIIYWHGGAWRHGRPEFFWPHAQLFLDWGYETYFPSYRRIPRYSYKDIREDIIQTLSSIQKEIQQRYIVPPPIFLGGMSSGGHIAALSVFDPDILVAAQWQLPINGLFLCGAPLDLRKMRWSPTLWYLAGNRRGQLFKQANPFDFLEKYIPSMPLFAMHGTADSIVEYPSFVSFMEKLEPLKSDVETLLIEGGRHVNSIDWVHTDGEVRQTLKNWIFQYTP